MNDRRPPHRFTISGEALRLDTRLDAGRFKAQFADQILLSASRELGIVGVHLLHGQSASGAGATVESRLRGAPDEVAAWILLIEAVMPESLRALRQSVLHESKLVAAGAELFGQ